MGSQQKGYSQSHSSAAHTYSRTVLAFHVWPSEPGLNAAPMLDALRLRIKSARCIA